MSVAGEELKVSVAVEEFILCLFYLNRSENFRSV